VSRYSWILPIAERSRDVNSTWRLSGRRYRRTFVLSFRIIRNTTTN